jgi:hypothetical protein
MAATMKILRLFCRKIGLNNKIKKIRAAGTLLFWDNFS